MKLCDIIPEGGICEDLQATGKEEVIKEMVDLLVSAERIPKPVAAKVTKALMDREELGSTGIGQGVAVPHAKHDAISDLVCAFGRSKKGINFDSLDGEPVHVLFLLLSSKALRGRTWRRWRSSRDWSETRSTSASCATARTRTTSARCSRTPISSWADRERDRRGLTRLCLRTRSVGPRPAGTERVEGSAEGNIRRIFPTKDDEEPRR